MVEQRLGQRLVHHPMGQASSLLLQKQSAWEALLLGIYYSKLLAHPALAPGTRLVSVTRFVDAVVRVES